MKEKGKVCWYHNKYEHHADQFRKGNKKQENRLDQQHRGISFLAWVCVCKSSQVFLKKGLKMQLPKNAAAGHMMEK